MAGKPFYPAADSQSTAPQPPRKCSFLNKTKPKLTRSSVGNRPALRIRLDKRPWSFLATNVLMISVAQEKGGPGKTPLHFSNSAWKSLVFSSILQHSDPQIIYNPIYFSPCKSQWAQELKHTRRWQKDSTLIFPIRDFRGKCKMHLFRYGRRRLWDVQSSDLLWEG